MAKEDLWIWRWTSGGYNSCLAYTREEAVVRAIKIAGSTILVMNESTLHIGTYKELEELDKQFCMGD